MEEIWKDIEGYEGFYQVSNFGRVRSITHRSKCFKGTKVFEGKILKQRIYNGYWIVSLHKGRKVKQCTVHRLVAKAFIPNPNNLPQVGHKDEQNFLSGQECNNNVENLEWTTAKDNNNMPLKLKRCAGRPSPTRGRKMTEEEKRKIAKATSKKVWCDGMIFNSCKECASYYNICYVTLSNVLRGVQQKPKKWAIKELYYLKNEQDKYQTA